MKLLSAEEKRAFWFFWTEPTSGHTAALFRIFYGILATWTAVGLLFNYRRYYSDHGMLPWRFAENFPEQVISMISLAPKSDSLLLGMALAFLGASLSMVLGIRARFCALLICAIQITLQHRNPYLVNAGDRLFLIMAGLGSLLPLSKQWSVESWWRSRGQSLKAAGSSSSATTIWSQRVVAMQMAYIYLYAFGAKAVASAWQDGTALFAVMASTRLAEWPVEIHQPFVIALATWGTIIFELSFPLLVWYRPYRPYLLAIGITFHVGIEVTLKIPMFSAIMIIGYISFLSDSESKIVMCWLLRPFLRGKRIQTEAGRLPSINSEA